MKERHLRDWAMGSLALMILAMALMAPASAPAAGSGEVRRAAAAWCEKWGTQGCRAEVCRRHGCWILDPACDKDGWCDYRFFVRVVGATRRVLVAEDSLWGCRVRVVRR
jgi:hypothetical protein